MQRMEDFRTRIEWRSVPHVSRVAPGNGVERSAAGDLLAWCEGGTGAGGACLPDRFGGQDVSGSGVARPRLFALRRGERWARAGHCAHGCGGAYCYFEAVPGALPMDS